MCISHPICCNLAVSKIEKKVQCGTIPVRCTNCYFISFSIEVSRNLVKDMRVKKYKQHFLILSEFISVYLKSLFLRFVIVLINYTQHLNSNSIYVYTFSCSVMRSQPTLTIPMPKLLELPQNHQLSPPFNHNIKSFSAW